MNFNIIILLFIFQIITQQTNDTSTFDDDGLTFSNNSK